MTEMASFFFVSSSKFTSPQQNCLNQSPLLRHGGKSGLFHSKFLRNLSHSHSTSHTVFEIVGISRSLPRCGRLFSAKLNTNTEESKGKQTSRRKRKRLDLRLKPRLKLASNGLKRVFRDFLDDTLIKLSKNSKKVTLSTVISFAVGLILLFLKYTCVPSSKVVPYSNLISNLQSGSVNMVLFEEGSRRIFYNTASDIHDNTRIAVHAESKSIPKWQYVTRKIDHDENFLLGLMREKGTTYSSEPQSVLMSTRSILLTIISLWIPLMPLMWLLYRQLSAANSPAKKRRPTNLKVNFGAVEGVDTAKEELMEIVSCLQGSIDYEKLGARIPRGVLLVGPPGTGKTLLARAVAGAAGVPFFSVSASEFVEMFVGRGAARIRDLFCVARKCSPSIVFIDELDAVGGKRGRNFNDERDQTLNQLLTEMDGFESDMKVIVIAATNRPEALDSALCRPGRFSRKVVVGEPDFVGRRNILGVHFKGVPLEGEPEIICNLVASLTPGFVGADLANIVNEAALLAARRGSDKVAREDVMKAVERAKFGIINERQPKLNSISNGLNKLFPWMTNVVGRYGVKENGSQVEGYQTLS